MLEQQKMVLDGVSFDKVLFRKELIKSLSWLDEVEQKKLVKWVKEKYAHQHADVIMGVFYPKYNYAS